MTYAAEKQQQQQQQQQKQKPTGFDIDSPREYCSYYFLRSLRQWSPVKPCNAGTTI